MKRYQYVIIIMAIAFISCTKRQSDLDNNANVNIDKNTIREAKVSFLEPIGKYTKTNEKIMFYLVGNMTYLSNNRIALISKVDKQVLVLSSKTGEVIKKLGRSGYGPGEYTNPSILKYYNNKGIYVYDNIQMKVVRYDKELNYVEEIRTKQVMDDFDIIDDSTWVVSDYALYKDYRPLSIFNPINNSYTERFGKITEVKKDIFKNNQKYVESVQGGPLLELRGISSVRALPRSKEFIYSQRNPYVLKSYDAISKNESAFNVIGPFSTEMNVELSVNSEGRSRKINKSSYALEPILSQDEIIVMIVSGDVKEIYLDYYNYDLKFVKRIKLPKLDNTITDIVNVQYADDILYILVANEEKIRWIERLKIIE